MAVPRGAAHLGTVSSHGGVVVGGSSDVRVCGIPGARCFDMHACPVEGHGVTPIVTCNQLTTVNGRGMARQFDMAACGAVLLVVCPTVG